MKNFHFKDILLGALIVVLITTSVAYRSGDVKLDEIVAAAIDADGTVAAVTITGGSFDCTFVNLDSTSTNTTDLTINAGSNKIRLYGGQSYNTQSGDIPIYITSFQLDAVVGTPDVQYFCWGQ